LVAHLDRTANLGDASSPTFDFGDTQVVSDHHFQ
jgi:hypothetical protein